MFRHDVRSQKHDKMNVICHQGGMGDLIMQLPAMKFLLKEHSYNDYLFFVHEYGIELVKKLLGTKKVYGIDQVAKYCNPALIGRSPYGTPTATNLAMHGVDHAFYLLVGNIPTNDVTKNYLKLKPVPIDHLDLPENYVCISTGFTSDSREWIPSIITETTARIKSELGLEIVYVGKQSVQAAKGHAIKGVIKADRSNGLDLVDKLKLFETHAVIAGSRAILGIDNGLLHLAGMTDTAIVAGYTSVNPRHRMPYRNGIMGWNTHLVLPEVGCRFCQSNMTLSFGHQFTDCYYKDFACLSQMKASKWIEALKSALKGPDYDSRDFNV